MIKREEGQTLEQWREAVQDELREMAQSAWTHFRGHFDMWAGSSDGSELDEIETDWDALENGAWYTYDHSGRLCWVDVRLAGGGPSVLLKVRASGHAEVNAHFREMTGSWYGGDANEDLFEYLEQFEPKGGAR